jgi:hypothetical protein
MSGVCWWDEQHQSLIMNAAAAVLLLVVVVLWLLLLVVLIMYVQAPLPAGLAPLEGRGLGKVACWLGHPLAESSCGCCWWRWWWCDAIRRMQAWFIWRGASWPAAWGIP